jgi:RHH-type transcriptional regulator, rel operon repressor / antitoxin RelB
MGTVTQSVRMDERTKAELAALAEATGRSLNYLMNEALDQYLRRQMWQVRRVQQALGSVEAGHVMPHDEVVADLVREGLFTSEEYAAELREARAEMEGSVE